MSDEKRPVPTGPGKWWRDLDGNGHVSFVTVYPYSSGLEWDFADGNDAGVVVDDGRWIAPVLTPAEADALRASESAWRSTCESIAHLVGPPMDGDGGACGLISRVERALASRDAEAATMREWAETAAAAENANAADLRAARAERDRYREAVGRLRGALLTCRVTRRDLDSDDDVVKIMAATTNKAIQGYDAPPADAGLLAKANAALVAEVAELRAAWVSLFSDLQPCPAKEHHRAEARRLGLIGEVPRG